MTGDFTRDDLFTVLSSRRRRVILRALDQIDARVTVSELVDDVAAREREARTDAQVPRTLRNSVYNTSVQNHLPKMQRFGVITFHEEVKDAEPGPNFEPTIEVLEAADDAVAAHATGGGGR